MPASLLARPMTAVELAEVEVRGRARAARSRPRHPRARARRARRAASRWSPSRTPTSPSASCGSCCSAVRWPTSGSTGSSRRARTARARGRACSRSCSRSWAAGRRRSSTSATTGRPTWSGPSELGHPRRVLRPPPDGARARDHEARGAVLPRGRTCSTARRGLDRAARQGPGPAELARQPEELRPFWEYGAASLGPAFTGFAEWVHHRAADAGVSKAFCLMREGELLAGLVNGAGDCVGLGGRRPSRCGCRARCARGRRSSRAARGAAQAVRPPPPADAAGVRARLSACPSRTSPQLAANATPARRRRTRGRGDRRSVFERRTPRQGRRAGAGAAASGSSRYVESVRLPGEERDARARRSRAGGHDPDDGPAAARRGGHRVPDGRAVPGDRRARDRARARRDRDATASSAARAARSRRSRR